MYDVNTAEINRRLDYLRVICDTAETLIEAGAGGEGGNGITRFAEERAVHLAAECVTDIGSDLIDGFIMRDASSYEDIVDILHGEQVFDSDLHAYLRDLVRQRKPLVQAYDRLDREELRRLTALMPKKLTQFVDAVRAYLEHELA